MAKPEEKKPADTAAKSPPPPKAELLKKLTTKLVMGDRVDASMVKEKPIHLYGVIGICTGFKTGQSQYGDWVGFVGQFEATRYTDGSRFVAPICFIPEPASSMMLSAIQNSQGLQQEVSIQFAFIIGAKKSTAAIGFEYTVEPVLKASQNDALAALREQIAPRLLAQD